VYTVYIALHGKCLYGHISHVLEGFICMRSLLQFSCCHNWQSQYKPAVQCHTDMHGLITTDVCTFFIVIAVATAAALGVTAVISSTGLCECSRSNSMCVSSSHWCDAKRVQWLLQCILIMLPPLTLFFVSCISYSLQLLNNSNHITLERDY
jgi:hypothetical protein